MLEVTIRKQKSLPDGITFKAMTENPGVYRRLDSDKDALFVSVERGVHLVRYGEFIGKLRDNGADGAEGWIDGRYALSDSVITIKNKAAD